MNKTIFTCEMIATDVGFLLKYVEQKVAPPSLMVTLRLVDGELTVSVAIAPHKFLYIWLRE